MQKETGERKVHNANSGMSFILPLQIAFPVLRTLVTPDDSYRHGSDFQRLRRRDTHQLSALAPATARLLLLGIPLSHRWHLLWTKSPSSVLRASRNKAGKFCQPTEDLSLL